MLRCAITDASRWPTAEARRNAMLADAERWAQQRVDFVQLREKQLAAGEVFALAEAMLQVFRNHNTPTKLLVNGRADVALAAGAHGVHLTSHPDELTPHQVREFFAHAAKPSPFLSASCHSLDDVRRATEAQADLILFGPVFEKRVNNKLIHPGSGLATLHRACAATKLPILALGGIDASNADLCLAAGAKGIAAIRAFAEHSRDTSGHLY